MLEKLCFDLCALAILGVLIFALEFRRTTHDKASRRLLALVVVTIIAALSDLLANYYNGQSNKIYVNYLCSGVYLIARNVAFYLYASYIITTTGTWYKNANTVIKMTRFIPIFIVAIFVITAPTTKKCFYYGTDAMYVRGEWIGLIYVCSAVYITYALYYIVKGASLIGWRKAVSLASCAGFSLAASYIQYKNPYIIIDILGFTVSLLFIILFVDNPGDKIESTSTLLRYQSYVNELKTDFFMLRPISIIHINVTNHRVIEEMLSYSNYTVLIKALGMRLKEINRKGRYDGTLCYLKNGKFRVILKDNNQRVEEMAEAVLEAFNSEISINDMEITVESSVCITRCPQDFIIIDDLLTFGAVAAKYEKPGEIVYSSDIIKTDGYNLTSNVDKLIEKGLLYDQFEVFYQPVYSVKEKRFTSAEALLRLRGEKNSIIEPEVFISAAEQNGAIIELGKNVIQDVCSFIKSDDFKKTDLNFISINLSVVQCLQSNLAIQILKTLSEYDVSVKSVGFELTESLASDNQKVFLENINTLADAGVTLSLDAYGTGYSNVSTLSSTKISNIKFDRTFTNFGDNKRHKDILENSIEMVKALGKGIVIEGVETEEMANMFSDCDYIQGFYYAKPMPREELVGFYQNIKNNHE